MILLFHKNNNGLFRSSMVKNRGLAVEACGVSRIMSCIVKMTIVCWHYCVTQSFFPFYIIQPYNEFYIYFQSCRGFCIHSYSQSQ